MADFQDSRGQSDYKERSVPFDILVRRFFREVQQSRILSEARKRRYRAAKEPSRKVKRAAARRKAARKKIRRGY